jgi:predicted nicotinamide N-methyase
MENRLRHGRPETAAAPFVKSFEARADFIRANTEIFTPPLVPEIKLHLAHEAVPLWEKTEEQLGELGLPPPFWAFAWAGGQALARYVLDNPQYVKDKCVIDLASGSGLVALAAVKAGAKSMLAADIDEFAVVAMALNAQPNDVTFNRCGPAEAGHDVNDEMRSTMFGTSFDLLSLPTPDCDIILVGDLFYEKSIAEKLYAWLLEAKSRGIDCLIGDPSRSYLPKTHLEKVAEYLVPVTRDLEDSEIKRTAVWRLAC